MRASRKLTVALACPDGPWPHPAWPAPDDPYIERVVHLRPPYTVPEGVDVVVLRCDERLRGLLSPRERQIMDLLSTGLGAREIGLRLLLSEKTVRNNLSNIYTKLDARGGTDAVLRWLGAAPVLRV